MDKSTAQRLVFNTFKAPFDRERYQRFVSELCNGFEVKIHQMLVPEAFTAHIKSCQRLGTFYAPDDELMDVLIVRLTESWKLERSRTALRDFVAHKLKRSDGEDNAYKEAGLIAFVAPDSASWRFSYVRMDYVSRRDPITGKIKTEEQLTPARRYSYLVGADEECHTAQARFLPLLQNTTVKPTLAQIEEAFSVESVTREFFNEYARLFKATDEVFIAALADQAALRADFSAKGVSTADLAKKLLGQIVFLYFIQKKGWLGVGKGQSWGEGPRHFMRQWVNQAVADQRNVFNQVFEPLFYDTLATDRGAEAWCSRFECRIPFLNGGLFEPLADYNWRQQLIALPNDLFTNTQRLPSGDMGSGILDVFDRYNFTVNEAEPLEKEVAIDPEMLGKVFENLIEENRRKGLGAFYTPREIVHYMCQESLIHYLHVALNQSGLMIAQADIEALIRQGEQAAHYESARKDKMAHYQRRLPPAIEEHAGALDTALETIRVCDPAIGSGAFPVGMMTEIVRARLALNPYFQDTPERTAYYFKRHAIQSSLYGVDIDPGAVEIAKLRLWLSLVVDEDEVEQIKPLPNLDYKVVAGNSLLGFPFKSQKLLIIEKLKAQFFDETDHDKKAQLKTEVEKLLVECFAGSRNSLGHKINFDFEINFSEVFHQKGGFDIVIGNPPYVRQEEIKDLKPLLKPRYACFIGTADLFTYFYERGIQLLHEGGQFAFITSNKWYRSGYGEKLRGWLAQQTRIHELIDFGDAPVFAAIAYPTIVLLERTAPNKPDSAAVFRALTWKPGAALADFAAVMCRESFEIPQRSLDKSGWRLEGVAKRNLLDKLRAAGMPLGEYCNGRFYYGIKTGFNDAFVVDRATRDRLIAEHSSSTEVLKPFLRGRDVKRWRVDFADQYLIKIESSENKIHPWSGKSAKVAEDIYAESYPAIHAFHEPFRAGLVKRADQGKYFWELRSCAYWQEFEQPKIVYPDIALSPQFSWDNNQNYLVNTAYIIPRVEKWLICIMNSRVCHWFYSQISPQIQNGYYRFIAQYCQQIPIPKATPTEQAELETLVQRILENPTARNVADLEAEINQRVYRLFGLNREEIKLVEGLD